MRIAYYLTAFPVVSETFVLNQITGLIDLGHDVEIIVARLGDTDVVHSDVDKYNLLEKIRPAGDAAQFMPLNKPQRVLAALRVFLKADLRQKIVLLRSPELFFIWSGRLVAGAVFPRLGCAPG